MTSAFRSSLLLAFLLVPAAQRLEAQCTPRATAAIDIQLQMQSDGGTNGAAVAYHPLKKRYYAVIAGNAVFPLETFDDAGRPLAQAEAGVDTRGLWWNPASKRIEGNSFGGSLFSMSVDEKGNILGFDAFWAEEALGSAPQACATGGPKGNVLYYADGEVFIHAGKNGKLKGTVQLRGVPVGLSDLNSTQIFYTGCKKQEIGLLNYASKRVYLFNLKKGSLSATIALPGSAPTHGMFRASYANGRLFLFDADARVWTSYLLFK
jgi:hypothetical protein